MTEMVFDIAPNGATQGLHFDEFDLNFLGKKKIGRASEIFHNEITDHWDIRVPGQDEAHKAARGFMSYSIAREFEVDWLQECRKREVDPASEGGAEIAERIRLTSGF